MADVNLAVIFPAIVTREPIVSTLMSTRSGRTPTALPGKARSHAPERGPPSAGSPDINLGDQLGDVVEHEVRGRIRPDDVSEPRSA